MALSKDARAAMTYNGPIARAVRERMSTADLWQAIRDASAEVPGGAPLPSFRGVNELRSWWTQNRSAGENFAAARDLEERTGLSQSITGAMSYTGLRARSADVLATAANYIVRYERHYVTPLGEAQTQHLTARYPAGQLPATVGELVEALSYFSPKTGTPTLGNLTGIGDINIEVV